MKIWSVPTLDAWAHNLMREQARRREKDCFGQKGATVLRQTQKRQLASLSSYRVVLTKSTARQGVAHLSRLPRRLRANRASYYRSCYRQTPSAVRQQTVWSDRPARASDRAVLATSQMLHVIDRSAQRCVFNDVH